MSRFVRMPRILAAAITVLGVLAGVALGVQPAGAVPTLPTLTVTAPATIANNTAFVNTTNPPPNASYSVNNSQAGNGNLTNVRIVFTITGPLALTASEVDVVVYCPADIPSGTPQCPTAGYPRFATQPVITGSGGSITGTMADGTIPAGFNDTFPIGVWVNAPGVTGPLTITSSLQQDDASGNPKNPVVTLVTSNTANSTLTNPSSGGGGGGTTTTTTTVPTPPPPTPPATDGYWTDASDGGIFSFGNAAFFGSMGGSHLNKPMVGMAATPDGGGYWTVASDGGIFSFGDAAFFGSMGGTHLNKPMVGMAGDPLTGGYWTVASDGGIFSFNAPFQGSMGGTPLNKPMVGMASNPGSNGYWTVASDGGIFSFNSPFFGSMGGSPLNKPMVGMAEDPLTGGYWTVASDGGIFSFNANFHGSMGGTPLNKPMVGMAAS